MRVNTKVVIDLNTDKVVERQSYEYEGPTVEAATYVKFQPFVEALAEKVHNLGSDQLVIALTATANAPAAANAKLGDLVQISYTNLSTRNITTSTSAQSSGTYKLVLTDLVLTASGAVAAFQYVVMYNDTATAGPDDLISYWDYASAVTLANLETFTVDFDATNGVLQLA